MKSAKSIYIIFLIALVLLAGCLSFTACNVQSSQDTLVVGTSTFIDTLNRLDAGGGRPGYAYTMMSCALAQVPIVYRTDGEYGSVICDFDVSEDGLEWSFRIKNAFYWHDGEPVTAEDLKFTLASSLSDDDVSRIAVNAGAVKITLKKARAAFLDGLVSVAIQPKHILENVTKDTITDAQSVIGCGPFEFVKRDTSAGTVEFKKFADYPYAADISIERVIFRYYGSEDSMRLALKAGEIDMIWSYGGGLDANAFSDLNAHGGINLISYTSNAVPKALFFNNTRLADARVKAAIKKAIDYEKIVRLFGTPMSSLPREGFVAPHVLGYKETAELKRDLEGAKSLLRSAGYGENNKFGFELLVRASGDDSQYADLIRSDLEETGLIDVTLVVKGSDWQPYYQDGRHMASLAAITAVGYNFEAGYGTRYLLTTYNSVMQAAGFAKNPVGHGQLAIDDGAGNLTEFGLIRDALASAVKADDSLKRAAADYQDYIVENTPVIALIYDKKVQATRMCISGCMADDTFGILNVQSFTSVKKSV